MKIYSIDNNNWLSVEPLESEGYTSFEVGVSVNIKHGVFEGKNIDINFLNYEEFLNDYDQFISNRKIEPILNGTYDSYFKFKAGKGNSIFLSFNISDSYAGYSATVDYSLIGEFEIDGEYLNEIHKNFKKLAKYA